MIDLAIDAAADEDLDVRTAGRRVVDRLIARSLGAPVAPIDPRRGRMALREVEIWCDGHRPPVDERH